MIQLLITIMKIINKSLNKNNIYNKFKNKNKYSKINNKIFKIIDKNLIPFNIHIKKMITVN